MGGSAKGDFTRGIVTAGTAITTPVPTKEGYIFDGWEPAVPDTMPDADVTYVAKWAAHVHKPVKVEGCEPTPGSDGWKAYYECSSCGTYFEDKDGLKKIPDLQKWRNGDGKIPKLGYKFLEGMNATWNRNSDKTLIFRANGILDSFMGLQVDGKMLDLKDYSMRSGSTIITLNQAYLQNLEVGTHTLTAEFIDGQCETQFTVAAPDPVPSQPGTSDPDSPKTGDENMLLVWTLISMFSLAIMIACTPLRRRHRMK